MRLRTGRNGEGAVRVVAIPTFEPLETRLMLSAAPVLPTADPALLVMPAINMSPNVTNPTPTGLTPAQVATAYGLNAITFNGGAITGTGAGQTIAIVDAYDDPNIVADLKIFDTTFGLSSNDGTGAFALTEYKMAASIAADSGWSLEIALDVEWAHAMAPGAHILLVEAKSASITDLLSAVDYARNASGVVAVSMSWGSSEFSSEATYDSHFLTPTGHIGGSGLAGGVTFVTASGDAGAPAEWPAVSPNVVAVGGTTLTVGAGGSYASETAWSGSGGGISKYESKPAYQVSETLSGTKRGNPDVAYDANPSSGFAVYDSLAYSGRSGWFNVGGTSAGAPQWAALVAIADQGRALAGKGALDGVGQTLPAIYSVAAADFHDITSGSNGYKAGAGYDLATGRGTPRANLLVLDLVNATGVIAPAPPPTPVPPPPTPPHHGRHAATDPRPAVGTAEPAALATSTVPVEAADPGAPAVTAPSGFSATLLFAKHTEGHGGTVDALFTGADPFTGATWQDVLVA